MQTGALAAPRNIFRRNATAVDHSAIQITRLEIAHRGKGYYSDVNEGWSGYVTVLLSHVMCGAEPLQGADLHPRLHRGGLLLGAMPLLLLALAHTTALNLLPCDIHGLSVSDRGFVALLADRPGARMLPLLVTPDDVETAASPQALTLLQLLQGIDLGGAILPPELLEQRCEAGERAAALKAVRVLEEGCSLCVSYSDAKSETSTTVIESAFEALALAMRYSAPIEVDTALLGTAAIAEDEVATAYPSCFTRQDAAKQSADITRRFAGVPCEPAEAADLDQLPAFDPASLTIGAPHAKLSTGNTPPALNANKPPPGMLEKALAIAQDKGDTAAIKKIQAMLDAQ